ncbi:MAG: YqgE/AlgH family protein [Tannerella sp.]|jgi:putative transcriptional regulator|nr:YqgE/AlgH family protein [Tannerella sp.]
MDRNKNIFEVRHNNLRPQKGRVLISSPFLNEICFQRAVILLVEHNAHGSMGFVLNKQTNLIVNSLFPELEDLPDIPIYLGGPVGTNHLFFMHLLGKRVPDGMEIGGGLCFDGNFEALKTYMLDHNQVEGKVKFFLGYSGWTENQLHDEIINDSWLVGVMKPDEMMMADDDDAFWKKSVRSLGSPYDTWTNYPKYPEMN